MSNSNPIALEAMIKTKDPTPSITDGGRSQSERSTRNARKGINDGPVKKKSTLERFLTPPKSTMKLFGKPAKEDVSHTDESEERAKTPTWTRTRESTSMHAPSTEEPILDYGVPTDDISAGGDDSESYLGDQASLMTIDTTDNFTDVQKLDNLQTSLEEAANYLRALKGSGALELAREDPGTNYRLNEITTLLLEQPFQSAAAQHATLVEAIKLISRKMDSIAEDAALENSIIHENLDRIQKTTTETTQRLVAMEIKAATPVLPPATSQNNQKNHGAGRSEGNCKTPCPKPNTNTAYDCPS